MREVVRLQGMLVAEEVSKKSLDPATSIKPLDFGDIWQEPGPNYAEIRNLKEWLDVSQNDSNVSDWEVSQEEDGVVDEPREEPVYQPSAALGDVNCASSKDPKAGAPVKSEEAGLIQVLDAASEFDDYDEIDEPDLEPFALPPKPAAQDLKDIDDLAAYIPEKKKAKPPVYIPDLCSYLKSDDADKLDVGLREAAGLIRRKAHWGTELGTLKCFCPSIQVADPISHSGLGGRTCVYTLGTPRQVRPRTFRGEAATGSGRLSIQFA